MGFWELSMLMHSVRNNIRKSQAYLLVAAFGTILLGIPRYDVVGQPQEDLLAFDDGASAPQASAPAQNQFPDEFNAAEQALLQGLNGGDSRPQPAVRHNFPSAAQIREVAAVKQPSQGPTVRRIKSQEAPTILDSIPALEPETFDTEAAPDLPADASASIKQIKSAQPESKQADPKPATPPAKKAAPLNTKQTILQEKLTTSETRARELERQLREAKSQLAAAELEISRLSSIVQNSSRARLNLPQTTSAVEPKAQVAPAAVQPAAAQVARAVVEKPAENISDVHVATISVEKADLRLGPGKNHSALMTLRRGSRLAIEARQGEWYRVFAPNGQRAWIHSSLVRFGDGAASLNDGSSVRMRGFDDSLR